MHGSPALREWGHNHFTYLVFLFGWIKNTVFSLSRNRDPGDHRRGGFGQFHVIPSSWGNQIPLINLRRLRCTAVHCPVTVIHWIFEICARLEAGVHGFGFAAIGTVCGAVLGGLLMAGRIGEESWKYHRRICGQLHRRRD